jgi:tetratricopeptide (TPR) repeat protein
VIKENSNLAKRNDFMPKLYISCARRYSDDKEFSKSYEFYRDFLIEFPNHYLANEVETALIENPESCQQYINLSKTAIVNRNNFMQTYYYRCGHYFELKENWQSAITMYESFLKRFSSSSLTKEVQDALARSLVAQAKENSGGDLNPPTRSGKTGTKSSEINIINNTPEKLRIVFSGPESMILTLDACEKCSTYSLIGPSSCSEGPSETYTLIPGNYDVVVSSISNTSINPWTGSWNLLEGTSYSTCFYIVTEWK